MAVKAKDFDQPIIFLFSVSVGVIGVIALLSWLFVSLGWPGPLGLVKGGATR